MVNIVFHNSRASSSDTDEDIQAHEGELNEIQQDEIDPQISQSLFRGWYPNNSREKITFSRKLIKSFGFVKGWGKNNSEKMDKFFRDIARDKLIRFSSKQLKIFTQNFSSVLGQCGYGKVYRGELANGVQVAVKVMAQEVVGEKEFMAEVGILARLYHRNLIKLFGFCSNASMKALVFEFMEKGALCNNCSIDWEKLYHIIIGTAKGISYMHECCDQVIIHCDIKPANILLDSNFSPKIADFGLIELYDRDVNHAPSILKGTRGYLAPELLTSSETTYKCDVYSFGITLFEVVGTRIHYLDPCSEKLKLFAKEVWDKFEKDKLEEILTDRRIEEKNREQVKILLMVALWCVQRTPENRPSMSTVVKILEGEMEITEPPNPRI
ncbi:Receptor-like protein kinase [Thalictrum thalictroides]|uniref:Receptor-like protein kinase n=1 Tax=Thalictrum thalictroides TaxID=46969 RepID=A0A7J6XBA4_THATH|nr:Receptor-like protein kinase [Thalictrum thalictroides]